MGSIYSIGDVFDLLRRRARLILAVIIVGTLGALWFAANQEHMYESAEVIQVAQPTIADELARSTVEGSSARRIQLIQQRLMSRATLLEIADMFDLFAKQPDLRSSERVAIMRESISLTGVAAAREGFADDGTIAVLTISARMGTPEQAQMVASEIGRRTIELSTNSRIEQARETLNFFIEKENALVDQLRALDQEITDFRTREQVIQPGVAEIRQGEISSINTALLEIAREQIEIRRAADQARLTERPATAARMLEGFDEQLGTLAAQIELMTQRKIEIEQSLKTSPDVEQQLEAYERQLEQVQSELEVVRGRRNEAEVGFRLENRRQSERLTIIEPAPLPDYPVTGSRKKLVMLGFAASIFMGCGLAFVLDLLNPVLRTAKQMKRETGLMPVVVIPEVNVEKQRRKIKRRRFWTRKHRA